MSAVMPVVNRGLVTWLLVGLPGGWAEACHNFRG